MLKCYVMLNCYIMKKVFIIVSIIITSLLTPQVAQAEILHYVNQGDPIEIVRENYDNKIIECTIGYVDKEDNLLWTAAHCADNKDKVYHNGEYLGKAYRITYDENLKKQPIKENYDQHNDIAFIVPDNDNIKLGENKYSGDRIVKNTEIDINDRICNFSRINNEYKCGEIISIQGNTIYSDISTLTQGDSGGSLWIPDKGFMSIASSIFRLKSDRTISIGEFSNMLPKSIVEEYSKGLTHSDVYVELESEYLKENPSVTGNIFNTLAYNARHKLHQLKIKLKDLFY